jgi:hypothetical protein
LLIGIIMKNKALLAIATCAAMFASAPAHALCDGCVVNAIQQATTTIAAKIDQVIGAIQGSSQTLATEQARSAEMIAQGNQRTQTTTEQARQTARFQLSDACAVLASTKGTADAARSGASLGGVGRGGGGGGSTGGGVSSDMKRAIRISAGAEPAPSPELQAKLASSGACSSFASSPSNAVRAGTCAAAGFSADASNGHPDADIRAETLFDGPQRGSTVSQFRRRLTIDADGPERAAVEAYMRNLNTPIDLRQLKKAELQSDFGRQYMTYRDAYEARMSLAEKPARSMAANHTANRDLLPVIQQLLSSDVTGQFVKNYLDKNYPRWSTNGISNDELNNLEAERRYLNRDWHLKMASLPPEAHTKEQTTIMAFQAVLMTRILERLEMMPQLIQLHGAASK